MKNYIIKGLASLFGFIMFYITYNVYYPIFTNVIALYQMKDDVTSYTALATVQSLLGYIWVIPVIISLLIFSKEIKTLIKKIGGKK